MGVGEGGYGEYSSSHVVDPKGSTSGPGRVWRGGSWFRRSAVHAIGFSFWVEAEHSQLRRGASPYEDSQKVALIWMTTAQEKRFYFGKNV